MLLPGAWPCLLAALLLVADAAQAIQLDINSPQSIKDAASQVTWNMMTYYHGNVSGHIPGAFPTKWWEGSALFMACLNYWHFTGDPTYNNEVSVGLEWQSGNDNYMPANYSQYLGNDDQMFWGLAAMTAAEFKLPDRKPYSWLSLAQGVFNSQIRRWDTSTCGGGLPWQISAFLAGTAGLQIKNSVSNGGLFQLSARLARYTYNEQYANWARKIWDWSVQSPLIDTTTWNVGDSTSTTNNCTTLGNVQWTYNYGIYLMGAAYMYNYTNGTEQQQWLGAVNGLLNKTFDTFFLSPSYVMEDWECEPREICNNNEILFKGLLSTWLAYTALIVPSTYETIMPHLKVSAQGAAASCTGNNNNDCGVRWYQYKWDGQSGMEEEISVSNIMSVNMLPYLNRGQKAPVTSTTGGNSTSNPNAGLGSPSPMQLSPITTGDRAGAGILTALFVGGWFSLIGWMIFGK